LQNLHLKRYLLMERTNVTLSLLQNDDMPIFLKKTQRNHSPSLIHLAKKLADIKQHYPKMDL
jgi:hypothetical protein